MDSANYKIFLNNAKSYLLEMVEDFDENLLIENFILIEKRWEETLKNYLSDGKKIDMLIIAEYPLDPDSYIYNLGKYETLVNSLRIHNIIILDLLPFTVKYKSGKRQSKNYKELIKLCLPYFFEKFNKIKEFFIENIEFFVIFRGLYLAAKEIESIPDNIRLTLTSWDKGEIYGQNMVQRLNLKLSQIDQLKLNNQIKTSFTYIGPFIENLNLNLSKAFQPMVKMNRKVVQSLDTAMQPLFKMNTKLTQMFSAIGKTFQPVFNFVGDWENIKNIPKENNEDYISVLKKNHKKKNICLFIGAGVSIDAGLPKWDDLLKELMKKTMDQFEMAIDEEIKDTFIEALKTLISPNPIIQARLIKHILGGNLNSEMKEILYRNYNPGSQDSFRIIDSIVQFCKHQKIVDIISYNYDDLLEQRFTKENIAYTSTYNNNYKTKNGGINIYHVHGLIPYKQEVEKHDIIFSEEDYFELSNDATKWNSGIQRECLRKMNCLLIGHSFTDSNLRRITEFIAKERSDDNLKHIILRQNTLEMNLPKDLEEQNFMAVEDFLLKIDKYQTSLLEKFGLGSIVFNEFKEISTIVTKIYSD